MPSAKETAQKLLKSADIRINGSRPWDIHVHNEKFYSRVLGKGALGLGESYMDGWWDCKKIDEFVYKIYSANLDEKVRPDLAIVFELLKFSLLNMQKKSRAFIIGKRHYDLGNELYKNMLDKRMNYSCAYWKNTQDLNKAQEAKLNLICKKLKLKKGLKDYRDLNEKFDSIVSIGMVEHVGYKNYITFMKVVHRCLKDNGLFLLHTIGGNKSTTSTDPWTDK